ncbi:MAG TPA: VOC family protein [Casimicrobiaceae bacterium]|nr:VOC family protein [Casimicrobiaceae bacterium]
MVQAIPAGYAGVTSYLVVRDAAKAIDFYKMAFGATEVMRMPAPGGKVGHAELNIAGGHIMLADESPEMGHRGVQSYGGSPISLMFYVPDVDRSFAQAIAAGGTIKNPVKDQFYGDRSGTLTDPFGLVWTIATHKEDVSGAEMEKRMARMMAGQST